MYSKAKILLFVGVLGLGCHGTARAEDGAQLTEAPAAVETPTPAPTAEAAPAPAPAPAAATPSRAAQSEFAKEQRLEDLRYKHLWIAYSLVWLIIFLFIRQTWRRSGAVEARLDELKSRLATLEGKGE